MNQIFYIHVHLYYFFVLRRSLVYFFYTYVGRSMGHRHSPLFSDVHRLLDPLLSTRPCCCTHLLTGVGWHGVAWGVLGILSVYLVPK
jgi:hypothetical protein